MKKKILCFITLFILTFTAIVMSPIFDNSNVKVSAASSTCYVYINPKGKINGYSYPNESGSVYFEISISRSLDKDIDVYYETKDKSAIASLGDYTAKSSYVTIPKNETSVIITINVGRSPYAVASPEGVIHSREFEVVLTDVVGIDDYSIASRTAKGMIGYNYVYQSRYANLDTTKRIVYFEEYANYDVSPNLTTDEIDGEGQVAVGYDFSATAKYSHWKKNFIDTGLASLYATFNGKIDDWGWYTYWSYADLYSSGNRLFSFKTHGYYDNEPLNPNNVGHEGYSWYESCSCYTDTQGYFIEELCCDCKGKFTTDSSSKSFHSTFYKVVGAPDYSLDYRSEGGRDRKLVDTNIYTALMDTTVAKVTNFSATSLTRVGDKLRFSIRFSEPVYLYEEMFEQYGLEKQTIKLVANSNANYITELTYAGGNFTDTLYYEIDYDKVNCPTEKLNTLMFFGGNGTIHDFAYGSTRDYGGYPYRVNNSISLDLLNTREITVDADLRAPVVEFSSETIDSIQKQHSVTLKVSNVELIDSKLYYSWEESTDSIGVNNIKKKTYYGSASSVNTITGGNYTGKRYLHVYIETKYLIGKYFVYDTALYFDNTGPTVTVTEEPSDGYKSRVFSLNVSDNFTEKNAGVKAVYMYYKKELEVEYTKVQIKTFGKNVNDHTFTYEVTATELGIPREGFDYVTIGFYAVDNLGNQIKIDYSRDTKEYLFDNGNTIFSGYGSINSDAGHEMLYPYEDSVELYFSSTYLIQKNPSEDLYITFNNYDPIYSEYQLQLESCYDMNLNKEINISAQNATDDPRNIVVCLNPTDSSGAFVPGYYRIRFYVEVNNDTYYSQYFYIYVSENQEQENTPNYLELEKQYVLNNYVYQLSLQFPNYYYLDSTGSLQKVPYATSTTAATFSSYDKAYQYVYYKELLDLYGKKISALEASYLNSGSVGTHRKAEGEETVAKEGQIWIRYKRVKWDYIDQESSWVWYCYDASTSNPSDFTIDTTVGALPSLLVESLKTVTTKIVKNGSYTYLVGKDYTDKYGSPKLNSNQMHVKPESAVETNCKTQFTEGSYAYYSGDPNIVKSTVEYNNENYYLATNFTLITEEHLVLFYKPSGSAEYQRLVYKAGMTYSEAIASNGLFDIIEAGVKGIKQYQVYIDRQAPEVKLSYVDTIGATQQITLTQENSGTYINAKSILLGQMQTEVDTLSYILLYKSSNLKLLDVITFEELKQKEYILENDHYTAHVYDRSGNFYVVNFRTNDSELNCVIKEQQNEYITIDTNRDASQIQYFEVYIDGELYTNVFSASLRLTKSGLYHINIKDWYGNVETFDYDFKLTLPTVDWKYEIDGQVYNYSEDNMGMKIQKLGDNEYFILSKGILQFTLKSGYGFEFIGDEPQYSHSYINNRVKFKEAAIFTVKIYYVNNPHVYVTYNVSFDETAPVIHATYIEKEYIYEELKYFVDNISNYQKDEILIPNELDFSVNSSSFNKIMNGQVFESDLITIKVNDGSGIYSIKVYLDGELIKEFIYGEDMNEISLSRRGAYKIVATDVLGNIGQLQFVNQNSSNHQFEIDSKDMTVKNSFLTGNESIKVKSYNDGEICYLIKCGEKSYYLSLLIEDGVIYRSYYYVGSVDSTLNSTLCIDDTLKLFEINADTKPNVYYDLVTEGLKFNVMYDLDGNFIILAEVIGDKVYDYECRVANINDDPFTYKGSLSAKKSNILINDYQNNVLLTNQEGNYIYVSKEFGIVENQNFDEIDYIKVYYSFGNEVEISDYIYKNDKLLISKFDEDGFYRIEIKNIYGSLTTYYIAMSNTFITTSKVVDKQGNEFIYSKDYNEKIYSNNSISLHAFSNTISYEVLKDGKVYSPKVVNENGQTIITLSSQGDYLISLKDEYGNEKVFTAEIKVSNLVYDEKLIYGYSDKAYKGYTNKKLSINHSLFDKYGISYVSVIYQGEETIIYDLINEYEVEFNLESFVNCIGFDNTTGEYSVVFKDKYGNEMRKVINFNDIGTLNLSRTTRSDKESSYDLNYAVEEGFWSNMELKFDSTTIKYEFKINGESLHLPYVLTFDNEGLADEIHYTIYYLDEYGFEYEFDACLSRKNIEINVLNEDVVVIDDLVTTKSNIELSFDEDLHVTYSIDGGNTKIYQGEELYIDGVYRIEATDKAGNKQAITIKKDTFVYYEFYNVNKSQVIISGEIVNSNQVNFKVRNNDTSYIDKVFLNGVLLEKYDSKIFSENGKWEFIVCDKMGNKSYFSFYQVLKAMQSFDYETPDYYKISEINYNSGNGVNISYMDYVQQNDINSEISLKENGTYKIKMTSILDNSSKIFEIRIDNSAPAITLEGCEVGGSTKEDVKILGYEVGDTVYIYRDGKLVSKTYISSSYITPPKINEGGLYEIVVESEAGVQTVIQFQRDYIANTAGSILITVLVLATVICLFSGLVFRNKLKVDE